MKYNIILQILLIAGCGHFKDVEETEAPDLLADVQTRQTQRLEEGLKLVDANGWLVPRDGDAIHWSGKFCAAFGPALNFDSTASEYPKEPGRFGRRAPPRCWTPELGNVCSDTSWSRDAFVIGLGPCALRTANLSLLQRHEAYGRSNTWLMGKPLSDGRVLYSPQVIGMLYQMIYSLGGPDNANRHWPSVYPSGLDDFEAHLQVMSIVTRGEISRKQGDADAIPRKPEGNLYRLRYKSSSGYQLQEFVEEDGYMRLLSINEIMYERLREHANREPNCPMYQSAFAIYSGDYTKAIELCEMASPPICSYVRCDEEKRCKLADDAYACDLILRRLASPQN